jgi:hypothetical protein
MRRNLRLAFVVCLKSLAIMKDKTTETRCALCEREVGRVSYHHLVPKSEGGRETVPLCSPCHKTLHAFFRNRTLSSELHSIEALRKEPEVARYLAWVRKQNDRHFNVRTRKDRR